jgi:ketosteroid isomerase-like protein
MTTEAVESRARQTATRYFERVQAGDVEGVVALFAPDATFITSPRPASGELRGRDEIHAHYSKVLVNPPRFSGLQTIVDGATCVIEIEAHIEGRGVVEVLDVMTVDDDGAIRRLSVYHR